jgi:hypothetical protein
MPYLISLETFEAVRERLQSGPPDFLVISKELGVSVPTVARIAEGKHYYQCDSAEQGRRRKSWARLQPKYLPTPEQIKSECARLRAARPPIEDDDVEADDSDGWPPPAITPGTLD